MVSNRFRAEMQRFGDGLHFFAFANALQDFQLAIGQVIRRMRAGPRLSGPHWK